MKTSLVICVAILGCSPLQPVLSGIPVAPILTKDPQAKDKVVSAPKVYIKADNVIVDVRHICGQTLDQVATLLHEQLGDRQSTRVLNSNLGVEYQYARGRIRVHGGVVYMMRVPLNQPHYRRKALQLMGFPAYTGGVIRTSGEYRINNAWNFRRIRLKRAGRDAEQVNELEAWRWLPRERQ